MFTFTSKGFIQFCSSDVLEMNAVTVYLVHINCESNLVFRWFLRMIYLKSVAVWIKEGLLSVTFPFIVNDKTPEVRLFQVFGRFY